MKFNFIIPTRNRKESLFRLLTSIEEQEFHPDEIIIVDDSDKKIDNIEIEFENLKINYVFPNSHSLTKKRNIGISLVKDDVDFICFLDDDIVFEENCLNKLIETLSTIGNDVAGVSMNIIDAKRSHPLYIKYFKKLFCMETFNDGKVLISGFNNPYSPIKTSNYGDWLCGGVTVWRKSVLNQYKFDEWFSGYGDCEDLEFSYRVGKKYKLFFIADAKVRHLMDYDKKGNNFNAGKMQSLNRLYFVNKNKELSILLCLYALTGQFLNNFFKSILIVKIGYLIRSIGNLYGIYVFFIKHNSFKTNL